MDERARALVEAAAEVRSLEARHEALRGTLETRAAAGERLREGERHRLEQGQTRVADLERAARYFAAADAELEERRREADHARRALHAGLGRLARARMELARSHAEHRAAENLRARRALEEQRREERAVDEAAEDARRALSGSEREGSA